MAKLARLRIKSRDGSFLLTEVTDIETGLVIPVRRVQIDMNTENAFDGIIATIEVPVEELELNGVLTKIETFEVDDK